MHQARRSPRFRLLRARLGSEPQPVMSMRSNSIKTLMTFVAGAAIVAVILTRPFSPRWLLEMSKIDGRVAVVVWLSNEQSSRYKGALESSHGVSEGNTSVLLKSASTKIPGGEIVFGDTSSLPGAFRIRFGDQTLSIQENRIDLEGSPKGSL